MQGKTALRLLVLSGLMLVALLVVAPMGHVWAAVQAVAGTAAAVENGTVDGTPELRTGWMMIQLFGGLALFLYGMDHLAGALRVLAGSKLRLFLGKMTRNRFVAVISGAVITALLQSSSVTTVLVVGFVSAGLMTLSQSIAVIMGANVGSTLTAQIIAFRVDEIAPILIAVGFAAMFFIRIERWAQIGRAVLGLGLLFFGMGMMGAAMEPLRHYDPFIAAMAQMTNPVLGIAIAALFTALVQSSAATTGIVIVLAGQGLLGLDAGIALIFGANIGTCVTALLGTIGKNRDALRTAVAHVSFNVIGVLIWLPLIPLLAEIVRDITPSHAGAGGADIARQIANAHSIFNILNVILMVGFVPVMARMIKRLVPDRKEAENIADMRPKYLNDDMIHTPAAALVVMKQEVLHMGEIVRGMAKQGHHCLVHHDPRHLQGIAEQDDGVDALQEAIVAYAVRLRHEDASPTDRARLEELVAVANNLEAIGDIVSEELVDLLTRLTRLGREPDSETTDGLLSLYRDAETALQASLRALEDEDAPRAEALIAGKAAFSARLDQLQLAIAEKVGTSAEDVKLYRLEISVIERIHRLFTRTRRIARNSLHLAHNTASLSGPAATSSAEAAE
ncbi:Na/Pi cotransporter family protein [Thalassospira marina]|uniref:Na/Pi cotransporter n=1 Tax=Thalassospira marina TaxID=2048283 RepID=A0A2N3KY73_9PROT|nr:Na/Pi cotransporter family protein [Thalassospira marina]PKR55515.1 Na/Pi cotransporter [Thalassospira marina]